MLQVIVLHRYFFAYNLVLVPQQVSFKLYVYVLIKVELSFKILSMIQSFPIHTIHLLGTKREKLHILFCHIWLQFCQSENFIFPLQWHQGATIISKEALCHNHFLAILCVFSGLYLVNSMLMTTSANEFYSTGLVLLTFQDALSPMEQVSFPT